MHKKPPKKLAMDSTLPSSGVPVGVRRRQQSFPEVGRTLSTYKYDAFSQSPPPRKQKKATKHKGISKKKIALFIIVPLLLIGGWLGMKFGYNLSKIFNGNVLSILTTSKLDGEETGRVNILLAGNSADDLGHNGGNLTDSIMIISIDVRHNTAVMLSVPRDLYVDIPGNGYGKINEAYVDGESQKFNEVGYAPGGMGLLEKTIYETIGVKSNYYALVNYTAFRDAVDAVGGIDVTIHSSDPRGLYDPSKDYTTGGKMVKLSNGLHHLTGQQALDLARARGDARGSYGYGNADFTRTTNQRMMLLSLKKKIASSSVLANPIKLSNLSDALGSNVKSDLQLSQVRRLYDLSKKIDDRKITSVGLNDLNGKSYLGNYRTRSGQSALVPAAGIDDYSDIRAALRRLFSNNAFVQENAQVVVLNATDVNGLAGRNQTKLEDKSINVTAVADARATQSTSQIIDASKGSKPQTLTLLKNTYGNDVTTTNDYSSRYPDADFIVILGEDQITNDSSTQD